MIWICQIKCTDQLCHQKLPEKPIRYRKKRIPSDPFNPYPYSPSEKPDTAYCVSARNRLSCIRKGFIRFNPRGLEAMVPEIYLPIAKHSAGMFFMLGLGGGVGFISGLFGIGGGFLMTPLLIMSGIPPVVAAASDTNQIIAAAVSGTYAHARMGNVDFKMGFFLLLGGWFGGTLGVEIIKILRALGEADFFIRILYVFMLGCVGSFMLIESLHSLRGRAFGNAKDETTAASGRYRRLTAIFPWKLYFKSSNVTISPLLPLMIGVFVGMISSILGVGGGFIMVPLMFYLLRMPMHLVVGTNLFQEAFLCINVTLMQAVNNRSVDLVLAMILLIGSSIGAQFGARASRKLHADQIRLFLAVIVLLVMAKIFLGLVLPPRLMLDMKGGM